jgi:hypothetical protein
MKTYIYPRARRILARRGLTLDAIPENNPDDDIHAAVTWGESDDREHNTYGNRAGAGGNGAGNVAGGDNVDTINSPKPAAGTLVA